MAHWGGWARAGEGPGNRAAGRAGSQNGRSSQAPMLAMGWRDTISITSGRLAQQRVFRPATCSLVSANGPSVTSTSRSRTRTVRASLAGRSPPPPNFTPRASVSASQARWAWASADPDAAPWSAWSGQAAWSNQWITRYLVPRAGPWRSSAAHQPEGWNGRTSIEPNRATGCLAATSIASSGPEHSITSYPAICSFVSANGPSLTSTSPPRTRTVAASRTGRSGAPSRRMLRRSISATQDSVALPTAALSSVLSWTVSATQISSR